MVLVYPADRLNVESANTLLKTLEEPPGALRFVLATEAAHALPATIRSRCQTHALEWPPTDEALTWLQAAVSEDEALAGKTFTRDELAVWLRAAGSRPDEALALARLGLPAAGWDRLPRAVAQGDWSALVEWSPARQLDLLQKLCHDLMVLAGGAEPRFFARTELPATPRIDALLPWHKALQQAARTVEHPYNPGLLQEAWAGQAHAALQFKP